MTKKIHKSKQAAVVMAFIAIISGGCGTGTSHRSGPGDELKGTISISGAFALYPMTVMWAEEFMKLNPDVRIDISAGGAGKGMTDVLSGMVDLAMFSRGVSQAEIENGAWYLAVTRDAVLPTINANNPALEILLKKGLKKSDFQEIYLNNIVHSWGPYTDGAEKSTINVYTRSDACGAAEMWGKYLDANQESLYGTGVFGDPGMADAVKNDKFGMGYNNVIYAFDMKSRKKYPGMEILPIDINENGLVDPEENIYTSLDTIMKAIQDRVYPSPPARDLYLISRGKPSDPVVIAFLEWILGEGQQYVSMAGYVMLSEKQILGELDKLK